MEVCTPKPPSDIQTQERSDNPRPTVEGGDGHLPTSLPHVPSELCISLWCSPLRTWTEESCSALDFLHCKEQVSTGLCAKDDLSSRSGGGTLASTAAPGPQALPSRPDAWNSLPASHPEQLLTVILVGLFLICSILVKELNLSTKGFDMFFWSCSTNFQP